MITVFDTETTGLPKKYNAPVSELENWPRLVQLAWAVYDDNANLLIEQNFIVKPVGFTIPVEASNVHGITTEKAEKEGILLEEVLNIFSGTLNDTDILVAHNIMFDEKIVGAEFIRKNISNNLDKLQKVCTKEASTDYCKLPGNYGYKWPNLTELHNKLFNTGFEGAHDALTDVRACARCFYELKRLGVLKVLSTARI
jgi:DNA polymerase-3 subunit epsilon